MAQALAVASSNISTCYAHGRDLGNAHSCSHISTWAIEPSRLLPAAASTLIQREIAKRATEAGNTS